MGDAILQGTTPILRIRIKMSDLLVSDIAALELTITSRLFKEPLLKHLPDCDTDNEENSVSYHFSEEETLMFPPEGTIKWQLRLKTFNNELIGTRENSICMVRLESGRRMDA